MAPSGVAARVPQVQVWVHVQRHNLPCDPGVFFSPNKTILRLLTNLGGSPRTGQLPLQQSPEEEGHRENIRATNGVYVVLQIICVVFTTKPSKCYCYFREEKTHTFQQTEWTFVSGCKRFLLLYLKLKHQDPGSKSFSNPRGQLTCRLSNPRAGWGPRCVFIDSL